MIVHAGQKPELERVVIISYFRGIFAMGVCAVDDATNEEILAACNNDERIHENLNNKSVIARPLWKVVVRDKNTSQTPDFRDLPLPCDDYPGRTHFVVIC